MSRLDPLQWKGMVLIPNRRMRERISISSTGHLTSPPTCRQKASSLQRCGMGGCLRCLVSHMLLYLDKTLMKEFAGLFQKKEIFE